jgi:hypothetical protein
MRVRPWLRGLRVGCPGARGCFELPASSGHFAATVFVSENEGVRTAGVDVYDLGDGRNTFDHQVGSGDADITAVVLTRRGSVAFIEGIDGPARGQPPQRLIARKHDRAGNAILEDSATVVPNSLRLAGHRVFWTSAANRSAPLS